MKYLLLLLLYLLPIDDLVLVDKGIYLSSYSQALKNPLSVKYSVYHFKGDTSVSRAGLNFRSELGVKTASNNDFTSNKWDKGHMCPAETFSNSLEHLKLTFSYVNCAVQHYQLNRGLWAKLENKERQWSQEDSLIIIVTVLFDTPIKKLPTGAAIPSYFVKDIFFYYSAKKLRYKFPNKACTGGLDKYLIK